MSFEKSVGAVIFRKEKGIVKYLLLHYPSSSKSPREYWGFPKGHVENGEGELDTVQREVEEETGLKDLKFIEGFKKRIKYFFKFKGETIFKIVTFYLAETKTNKIEVSSEHIAYQWLPYKEALGQLTFNNAKEILKRANDFIPKEGL